MTTKIKIRPWILYAGIATLILSLAYIGWNYYQTKPRESSALIANPPGVPTDYKTYKTKFGLTSFKLMDLSENKWQGVSVIPSLIKNVAYAAENSSKFVIDFSRNFSKNDSFQTISKMEENNWLLGGGTNAKITLYKTDFENKIEDLSSKLPLINQNSTIKTIDTYGTIWLLGFDNTSASKAQIVKYDGSSFQDISSELNPPELSTITKVKYFKNTWLVFLFVQGAVGGTTTAAPSTKPSPQASSTTSAPSMFPSASISNNPYSFPSIVPSRVPNHNYPSIAPSSNPSSSKAGQYIYKYNGQTFENISNLFQIQDLIIEGIDCNNDYCLLGGSNQINHKPLVSKYNGTIVEDLSSNINGFGSISAVSSNGNNFLLAGSSNVQPNAPSQSRGLLYLFDGSKFTNLSENIKATSFLSSIGNDTEDNWLIGGVNWDLYNYNSKSNQIEKIPVKGTNTQDNNIKSIVWDGTDFIIGGWQSLILKVRLNLNN